MHAICIYMCVCVALSELKNHYFTLSSACLFGYFVYLKDVRMLFVPRCYPIFCQCGCCSLNVYLRVAGGHDADV